MSNFQCKLCSFPLTKSDESRLWTCPNCKVEFGIEGLHFYSQTYRLNDPDFFCLIMHLDTEFTIIALQDDSPLKDKLPKLIPVKGIWPKTQAHEALRLAQRLLNLLTYT